MAAPFAMSLARDSPQSPGLPGSIPEQTIFMGESMAVDACFDDPGGIFFTASE